MSIRFLWCLAKAVVRHGGKFLANRFGGELVYEIAVDAWQDYSQTNNATDLRRDVEALAQASPDEVRQQVQAAIAAEGSQLPPQVQQAAVAYLTQVPGMIRRSLRRSADPSGTTVPASLRAGRTRRPDAVLAAPAAALQTRRPPLPRKRLGAGGIARHGRLRRSLEGRQPHLGSKPPRAFKFCLDGAAVKSLRNEAGVLDRVMQYGRHPGIVELLDTHLNADPPCLEYEFVPGSDLTSLIRELHAAGSADVHVVNRRFLQLVEIVAFAHQAEIVHDDLKPANILVQRTSGDIALRITDFGIGGVATVVAAQESRRPTRNRQVLLTEAVRGAYTPMYASLEQMLCRPPEKPDPRDDVHALGVIWFQMLTGDLTMLSVPTDWRDEVKERGLSEEIVQLLASCFARKAEKRLDNAVVLARQLTCSCPKWWRLAVRKPKKRSGNGFSRRSRRNSAGRRKKQNVNGFGARRRNGSGRTGCAGRGNADCPNPGPAARGGRGTQSSPSGGCREAAAAGGRTPETRASTTTAGTGRAAGGQPPPPGRVGPAGEVGRVEDSGLGPCCVAGTPSRP